MLESWVASHPMNTLRRSAMRDAAYINKTIANARTTMSALIRGHSKNLKLRVSPEIISVIYKSSYTTSVQRQSLWIGKHLNSPVLVSSPRTNITAEIDDYMESNEMDNTNKNQGATAR